VGVYRLKRGTTKPVTKPDKPVTKPADPTKRLIARTEREIAVLRRSLKELPDAARAQASERITGLERYIARLEASAPAPEAQRPQADEPDDTKPSSVATDAKEDDTLRTEPRADPAKVQEQAADLARHTKQKVLRDFANDPKEDARWLLREIGPSALDNIRAAISEVLKADEPVTTSDRRAT
jgi:hypothetical protein